jgi:hypothetical protein
MGCGEAAQHEPNHREIDEGDDGSDMALEIAGQPAAMADPGQGSFDDPAFRQHLETGTSLRLTISSRHLPVLAVIAAMIGPFTVF